MGIWTQKYLSDPSFVLSLSLRTSKGDFSNMGMTKEMPWINTNKPIENMSSSVVLSELSTKGSIQVYSYSGCL